MYCKPLFPICCVFGDSCFPGSHTWLAASAICTIEHSIYLNLYGVIPPFNMFCCDPSGARDPTGVRIAFLLISGTHFVLS